MATATAPPKQELQTNPFTIAPITFEASKEKLVELVEQSAALSVVDINDKKGIAAVRESRLELKRLRGSIETRRKELKAESLEYGRKVDGIAKELTAIIEPEEKRLQHEEDIVKREEERLAREDAERKRAILRARLAALAECGCNPMASEVEALTQVAFEALLADKQREKAERDARIAEEKAESERIAAAQKAEAERLEAARAKLEEQRLEQERIAAEQRRVAEERMAKERAEIDRIKAEQAAAQAKIDAENKRIADELAERERQAELAKATAAAAEKARLEAIAEQERKESEAKAAAEAAAADLARLEALRPDHEKLLAIAAQIDAIEIPKVSKGAQAVAKKVSDALKYAANDVRGFCKELTAKK